MISERGAGFPHRPLRLSWGSAPVAQAVEPWKMETLAPVLAFVGAVGTLREEPRVKGQRKGSVGPVPGLRLLL